MTDQDQRDRIKEAIQNSVTMLHHAALRGVELKADDIEHVVAAGRAVQQNNLTEEQERAFWVSAAAISKSIAPVTLESLEASIPKQVGKKLVSAGAHAAARYRVRTIITLLALLIFQIYWLIGATVVTDVKDGRERLQKIESENMPLKRSLEALKAQDKPEDQAQILKIQSQLDELESKLWVDKISVSTNFSVLKNWNVAKTLLLWQKTVPPPNTAQGSKSDIPDSSVKASDYFLWVFTTDNVVEFQTAQIVLTALLKYILPILYGALGASAFIVRTLANEIRDVTYSPESNVRYQLRFYLGAVAGFSIAWFTSESRSTETVGILQSLSPLALAFLAGYSVDLLFSLLDRIVVAFSGPEPKRTVSAG